jgi:hypothetical protein
MDPYRADGRPKRPAGAAAAAGDADVVIVSPDRKGVPFGERPRSVASGCADSRRGDPPGAPPLRPLTVRAASRRRAEVDAVVVSVGMAPGEGA